MAVEKSYAKLGFFIVVALIVVLGTAALFVQRLRSREVIAMVTYTTDNVFGLDVSSAVRYKGVPVGRVTDLRVDPRGNLIEIDFEVFLHRLNTIGMNVKAIRRVTDIGGLFPRLRARIMGNPLTGEAYLLLDSPENPPQPIELGFKPNRPYVPSMPSPFATVKERLPEVLDRAETTLQSLRDIIARVPESLDRSDRFFTNVERIVQQSDLPGLSADSRKFFATTTGQIEQMRSDLNGLTGTEGSLVKFSEEARCCNQRRRLSGSDPISARGGRQFQTCSRRASALHASHPRFARTDGRTCAVPRGATRVGRSWSTTTGG